MVLYFSLDYSKPLNDVRNLLLIMSSGVWDSLGAWLLGNNQDEEVQSTAPSLCSLKAAFLEFRP